MDEDTEPLEEILKRFQFPRSSDGAPEEDAGIVPLKENCPNCYGVQWVKIPVPLGHPQFGAIQPCYCWEQASGKDRYTRLRRYSNLDSLARYSFESIDQRGLDPDVESQGLFFEAFNTAQSFATDPKGWLVLSGPSGSGKTHLAASIGHIALEKGIPALFVVVPDLLDHLRSSFFPESDNSYDVLFDQVRDAPLLILDDFGMHSSTPWAQEKLFQLLNHRFNVTLPTVITLSGPIENLDTRLISRLQDPSSSKNLSLSNKKGALRHRLGAVPQPMLEEMTFENFETTTPTLNKKHRDSLEMVWKAAKQFSKNPAGQWLVLGGGPGVGKTHLAISIINENVLRGDSTFFAFVPELLDHLRYTFAPHSPVTYDQLFDEVKSVSLLILDDLGSQSSTPWAEEKLYQLLVYRHNARLPTVITVDTSVELKPAIGSRLRDIRFVLALEIDVPDHRDKPTRN